MADLEADARHYFSKEDELFNLKEYAKAIIAMRQTRKGFSDATVDQNIGLRHITSY